MNEGRDWNEVPKFLPPFSNGHEKALADGREGKRRNDN